MAIISREIKRITPTGDVAAAQVWEMDKPDHMMLLPVERAELPATPLVRVNKPANLLAVSTANNTLNILANAAGMQLLGTIKPAQPSRPEASVSAPPPGPQVGNVALHLGVRDWVLPLCVNMYCCTGSKFHPAGAAAAA